MACGVKWQQIGQLDNALKLLDRAGLGAGTEAFDLLYRTRGRVLNSIGLKFPRTVTSILKLIALSPGTITLWNDVEAGWLTSARSEPGAPLVWKYVSDDIVEKLLKRELTHELEEFLWTPDPYIGE